MISTLLQVALGGALGASALAMPTIFTAQSRAQATDYCNAPTGDTVTLGFNVPQSGPYAEEGKDELLAYGTRRLLEIDGLRLFGTAADKVSVLAFELDGAHPLDGATVANLSPALAEELGFDPYATGIIVTAVDRRSAAALEFMLDFDASLLHLVRLCNFSYRVIQQQ